MLAYPEQGRTEQDRFVGFHLVYEPAPSPVRSEISKTSTGWNTVHRPWTRDPAALFPSRRRSCRGRSRRMGPCTSTDTAAATPAAVNFGFNQTRSETERINGDVTQQSHFRVFGGRSDDPRSDAVSIQQYSRDQRLLRGHPHRRGGWADSGRDLDPPWAERCGLYPGGEAHSDGTWTFNLFPRPYREGCTAASHRLVSGHSGDGRPGDGGAGADGPSLNPDPHSTAPRRSTASRGAVPPQPAVSLLHRDDLHLVRWRSRRLVDYVHDPRRVRVGQTALRSGHRQTEAFSPMKATQSV